MHPIISLFGTISRSSVIKAREEYKLNEHEVSHAIQAMDQTAREIGVTGVAIIMVLQFFRGGS